MDEVVYFYAKKEKKKKTLQGDGDGRYTLSMIRENFETLMTKKKY